MLIVIGGPAGAGKTTLADAVASALHAAHLDFDVVSSDVVAAGRAAHPHLSEAALLARLRDDRYLALAQAAATALASAPPVLVVSAPFSREAQYADAWQAWLDVLPPGTDVRFVWIDIDAAERRRRMLARGSIRDRELLERETTVPAAPRPAIAALLVSAAESLPAQVAAVVTAVS